MTVVRIALSALLFVSASVWLGGLVLLAIATRLIGSALKGRRTEGRQIIRRLREVFQKVELIALAVTWVAAVAHLVLARMVPSYPGQWTAADATMVGLLVVPTLAAAYSTFYLTGAAKRREAQLGNYADKNEQIRVRKSIGVLMRQAEMLNWLKAVLMAGVMIAAVVAFQPPAPAEEAPPVAQTQPTQPASPQ